MDKTPLWGLREVIAGAGLASLAVGLAMQSIPLALVVVGGLLFGLAVWPLILPRRGD